MRPHHSARASRSQTAAKAYRLSGALSTSDMNSSQASDISVDSQEPMNVAEVDTGGDASIFDVEASNVDTVENAMDFTSRPQRVQTVRRKLLPFPSSSVDVQKVTVAKSETVKSETVKSVERDSAELREEVPTKSRLGKKSSLRSETSDSIKKQRKKTQNVEHAKSSETSEPQLLSEQLFLSVPSSPSELEASSKKTSPSNATPESEAIYLSIRRDGIHVQRSKCDHVARCGDTSASDKRFKTDHSKKTANHTERLFPRCVTEEMLDAESREAERATINAATTTDSTNVPEDITTDTDTTPQVAVDTDIASGVIQDTPKIQRDDSDSVVFASSVTPRGKGTLQQRLRQAEFALRCSQAELAVSRLETLSSYTSPSIRQRLEAILQAGAKHLDCDATAFYMIDPTETSLRLHVSQGLPASRFTEAPRLLHTARADLNAMLGDVVSFEEDAELPISWNSPEPEFPSAICARVSSPTRIHGTLWAFSQHHHTFAELEMQYWLQTASRIALELENELLVRKNRLEDQTAEFYRSLERRRRMQFPTVGPFLEDWEFSGYTVTKNAWRSGTGYDWFCGHKDAMLLTLSEAGGSGPIAAISASELRMTLRALATETTDMSQLLQRVHRTLWTASAGDEGFSAFVGCLCPQTGVVRFSSAGSPGVFLVLPQDIYDLSGTFERLAMSPVRTSTDSEHEEVIAPGAAMLLLSQVPNLSATAMRRLRCVLRTHLSHGAIAMSIAAREFFAAELPLWWNDSRSMLVIRRRS